MATAAELYAENATLGLDVVVQESDTKLRKKHDGVQTWRQLPYEGTAVKARQLDPDDLMAVLNDGLTLRTSAIAIPQHRVALRKWYAHLANRDIAPAQIIVRGDSIGEGTGATLTARRWQQVLQKRLRTQLGIVGGADVPYITAALAVTPTIADYPSTAGVGTSLAENDQAGLGNRMRYSAVSGYTRLFTAKMTSAKLLYATDTDTAVMQYQLDAGTLTGFTTVASGSRQNSQVLSAPFTGLDGASHTITVRRSTGTLRVEGVVVYNGDENSGLRVYDASHHGTQSDRLTGTMGAADLAAQLQLGAIGLNIVGMGTNDINTGVSAAAYKANNLAYIVAQRAAGFDGSFIFYLPATLTSNPLRAQYMTALREIEAGDPDVLVVDWLEKMPAGTLAAAGLGLYYDVFHNSDKGQAYIADFFTQILIPA